MVQAVTRIGYYMRHAGNLHYFAGIKPYLDHFVRRSPHQNSILVRSMSPELERDPEIGGYADLFTVDGDLDRYDLVLTPTFLRPHERTARTRAVQIFHGMSDKPFTYERDFSDYLLCLCVGQRQVDRLLSYDHNKTMKWVIVGYPKFDDPPLLPKLFDNEKKTITYCPTWRKGNLSSIEIFLDNPDVVDRIFRNYNLIVKPHPNILNPAREFYDEEIVRSLKAIPGIRLAHAGNVIPWFGRSDLYIGDISASGYEWLYFDRPMVFLNPQPGVLTPSAKFDDLTYLWQCGDVCDDMADLQPMIECALRQDRHRERREKILSYSVHNARDGGATARGIRQIEALLRS